MDWCGVRLDPVRNEVTVGLAPGDSMMISEDEAPVACYVVGVDEEVEIARATLECVRKGQFSK
jgi:acetate kinase